MRCEKANVCQLFETTGDFHCNEINNLSCGLGAVRSSGHAIPAITGARHRDPAGSLPPGPGRAGPGRLHLPGTIARRRGRRPGGVGGAPRRRRGGPGLSCAGRRAGRSAGPVFLSPAGGRRSAWARSLLTAPLAAVRHRDGAPLRAAVAPPRSSQERGRRWPRPP